MAFCAAYKKLLNFYEAAHDSGLVWKACTPHLAGYYVYALLDPHDDTVFYVGKGSKKRYKDHFRQYQSGIYDNPIKINKIDEIVKRGRIPAYVCIADGLTETEAFNLEANMVRVLGYEILTNSRRVLLSNEDKLEASKRWARDHLARLLPYRIWKWFGEGSEEFYNRLKQELETIERDGLIEDWEIITHDDVVVSINGEDPCKFLT